MENSENAVTPEFRFVTHLIERCQLDKGTAAKLRRADNPATEYQSWEILVALGIDLEKPWRRLPAVTISAAIAKSKPEKNGSLKLGEAVALCYEDGRESTQAKARLRRLLACDDLAELCRILRQTFALIDSKVNAPLDFARILKQLWSFGFEDNQNRIKVQWAQEFYRSKSMREEENL